MPRTLIFVVLTVVALAPTRAEAQAPTLARQDGSRSASALAYAPPAPPREWVQVPPDLIALGIPSILGGALTMWWGRNPGCNEPEQRLTGLAVVGGVQLALGVVFSTAWIVKRRRRVRESGGRASRHPSWAGRGLLALGLGITAAGTVALGGLGPWVVCGSS